MKLIPFGALPFQISEIGFGTSQLANTDNQYVGTRYIPAASARNILQRAIDLGINFFDTSPTYGAAENLVGEIKRKYKDKIIVSTKAGLKSDGTRDFSIPFLEGEIERSLKGLQVDCLDVFQLNKPSRKDLANADLFVFLNELKKQGKIKYSGVVVGEIDAGYKSIESGMVDCLQIFYNLLYQDSEDLILKAHSSGLGVLVRSPLNSGLLKGAYKKDTVFDSNDARSVFFSGDVFAQRLEVLKKIQKDLDISNSQLMEYSLSFILSHRSGAIAIPGASKYNQLDELANITKDTRRFTEDELKNIKATVARYMGPANFTQQSL
jgi:aryl-alcohol dehydrogenase-like predicted oxidoreductase